MIYVITHKKFDDSFIDKEHYSILHVGENDDCKEYYLRDDIGINISKKNPNYCELTGLYWIWKNVSGNGITGLVHYRRFFTTSSKDFFYTYFNIKPSILSYDLICRSLKRSQIILPKPDTIVRTVREFYCDLHIAEDLDLSREAIKEYDPVFLPSFDKVMNEHHFIYANMMICHKEILDDYCEWLFGVLGILESKIDLNKYDDSYQSRVYGFISERLLQVWVEKNNIKKIYYPVFNTDKHRLTIFQKNINRFHKAFLKS